MEGEHSGGETDSHSECLRPQRIFFDVSNSRADVFRADVGFLFLGVGALKLSMVLQFRYLLVLRSLFSH